MGVYGFGKSNLNNLKVKERGRKVQICYVPSILFFKYVYFTVFFNIIMLAILNISHHLFPFHSESFYLEYIVKF